MFVEFRDLERIKNNKKKFFELFIERSQSLDVNEAISLLKKSGICINKYKPHSKNLILEKILVFMNDKYKANHVLLKFKNEVKIWCKLFNDFNILRDESGVNLIEDDIKLSAVLNCAEKISQMIEKYANDQMENVQLDINLESTSYDYEGLISDLSMIFKHITFTFEPNFKHCNSMQYILLSKRHFDLIKYYSQISNLYDVWAYFDGELLQNDNEITFQCVDQLSRIALENSRYISQIQSSQINMLKYTFNNDLINKGKKLPPESFYSEAEFTFYYLFHQTMYQDDLSSINFYNISVLEWIRAYSILIDFGRQNIQHNSTDKMIRMKAYQIINIFEKYGIKKGHSMTIINTLTFDPEVSTDLFDSPLLKYDNYYYIFPFILYNINFTESFISCLQSRNYDLSKRGYSFEDELISLLNNNKIDARSLKINTKGEEYQCDVSFHIDNHVYFIESKVFLEPKSIRKKYEHLKKIEDSIDQLKRISDFYIKNENLLNNMLDYREDNTSKKYIKILVTSSTYSGPPLIGNTYVIDYSSLQRFLLRDPINITKNMNKNGKIIQEKINVTDTIDLYTGDLTNTKILDFLNTQPPNYYSMLQLESKEKTIKISGYSFTYTDIIKTTPSILFTK